MKKYKIDPETELTEIVIPFGEGASSDGLFDDCPLCQKLKKEMEKGNGGEVIMQWEDEEAN